jgi:hypothetical protein
MEQILALLLGASAVILIGVIVLVFRTRNKVNTLSNLIDDVLTEIHTNDNLVNRRIDAQIDFTTNLHKESLSYTDSRVDKLETKFIGTSGAKEIPTTNKKTNQKNKITK